MNTINRKCPDCKGRVYKTESAFWNHVKVKHPAIFLSCMFYAEEKLREEVQKND